MAQDAKRTPIPDALAQAFGALYVTSQPAARWPALAEEMRGLHRRGRRRPHGSARLAWPRVAAQHSGPVESLSARQDAIMALAREAGRVSVDALAERFEVSPQTIRKDLNELCEARLLSRVHGGAMLASGTENMAHAARRALAAAEKRRIAAAAARLVPDGSSLFINIGTTTEEFARAIAGREGLLVITNNLHVVSILLPSPRIEVVVAGGLVRRADGGIVGEATLDMVAQFKVDIAVIGASALDEDGTLLDFDWREVRVTQKIIENARKVVLVADALKFARTAPVRIAHVAQLAAVVTDAAPPARFSAACEAAGVELIVATSPEADGRAPEAEPRDPGAHETP